MTKPAPLPPWRRRALLASAAFILAPGAGVAWAQEASCAISNNACTIAAGTYTSPYYIDGVTNPSLNVTSNGSFNVTSTGYFGALGFVLTANSGQSVSSGNAGNAGSAGPLTLTSNGSILQYLPMQLGATYSMVTLYAASVGGNGGWYENSNADGNAGYPGNGGTATLTSNAPVQLLSSGGATDAPNTLRFGAALLSDSQAGAPGGVSSNGQDSFGNPTYSGGGRASFGGGASAAWLTNNAAVTVNLAGGPYVALGFVGAGARSLGGDAGPGPNGPVGGNGNAATVINTSDVSVTLNWASDNGQGIPYTPAVTAGAFALLAESRGGNGTMSRDSSLNGGYGGPAGPSSVTAGLAGTPVTVSLSTGNPNGLTTTPLSAAIAAISRGGGGGQGYKDSTGGAGGVASPVSVTTLDSLTVRASGDRTLGILALAQGGAGGISGEGQDNSAAGNGGSAGATTDTTIIAGIGMTNTVVSTTGLLSPGVMATAQGGAGGAGQVNSSDGAGGRGAGGGNTGPVQVTMSGGAISTTGGQSPGLVALAQGGLGGVGGELSAFGGSAGDGGSGGAAGPVTVIIQNNAQISTIGAPSASNTNPSHGVYAASLGGTGGAGGSLNTDAGGASGAGMFGGTASNVTVTVTSGAITTQGQSASAIAAFSIGGNGGAASDSNAAGFIGIPATGGNSGSSGTVSVTNAGSLTTYGSAAHGIFAVSRSGVSGNGSNGTGFLYGPGGDAGTSGTTGNVMVTNTGTITTFNTSPYGSSSFGSPSFGILAQSLGGGSGAGGSASGSIVSFGGSGMAASNAGTVTVNQNAGGITTVGDYALGILAQSVGGGGGNAGDARGVFGSIGGSGGGGGAGNTAQVSIGGGSIITNGRLAHGVVAQSVGGGGGNGGDATTSSTVLTLSIGGTGGSGGTAGQAVVNATGGSVSTQASNAIGVVAQSVGGGGGTGGSGYAFTGGTTFSAAVALGASGGSGGAGGSVTLNLAALNISTGQNTVTGTNQNPVDAYGIVAQSIGGGGGVGGSAAATAITFGIPMSGTYGNSYAGSVAMALGGAGGTGGGGGTVNLTMNGGGSVTTQGQGSHGILLQSVGGGGGAGGDSSAMAMTISYGRASTAAATQGASDAFSSEISIGVGGSAANAAAGGSVTAYLDQTSIMTLGDQANGLVAQSIGGGGGNAGFGSSTTLAFGSTRDLNLSVALGGKAGGGGAGGGVSVTIEPQAVVQTYGASAIGIVAQSIGGGGGTAQGGTINLGGAFTAGNLPSATPSGTFTFNLGASGGAGGDGGGVTMVMQGQVRTSGSDAAGVVLQSLGGGGGIGGSAGTEASFDNPVVIGTKTRAAISDAVELNLPLGFSKTLNVGSGGGPGVAGNGSGISYSQGGGITTLGDWSHGLVAQSIGGGGGMGGLANSSSSLAGTVSMMRLGSQGNSSGNGGDITLTFGTGSTISTGLVSGSSVTGYAAFGVLAQSIGGGGGVAADASTAPSTAEARLGAQGSVPSGTTRNGGTVTINGTASIVTRGAFGMGMVLQSIGGGGGVAGSGNSLSLGAGVYTGFDNFWVGGGGGTTGNGGSVTTGSSFAVTIQTSGSNAFGILAQSIGGSGGLAFSPGPAYEGTYSLGPIDNVGAAGNGGAVTLTLTSGSITTSGLGAHGIVAQSIGGSGGIAGLPTAAAILSLTPTNGFSVGNGVGSGEGITINSNAAITTTGAFAHGILAQSIGGGGGLWLDGSGRVLAGTTGVATSGAFGLGGAVNITNTQPILATGANSVGVFAQSRGVNAGGSQILITANASITGGPGQGMAIWVDTNVASSLVSVGAGATISAASGLAITMTAGSVTNSGTVTGSYTLNDGSFTNAGGGTLNAGAALVAAELDNAGTLRVAAHVPHGVSRVSQDFVQRASGRMLVDADFGNRQADMLVVAGDAALAGRMRPLISSVLPDIALPFLTVLGTIRGTIEAENSTLFTYRTDRKEGGFTVTATGADFTPPGYSLSRNIGAVAGHMQAAWDAGGNLALGPLFALLGNTADAGGPGAYSAALRQISPSASLAPGARVMAGARAFANAALSCPQFEGTTAMLREGECVWATLTGRTTAQASMEGLSSFRYDTMLLQAGGQRAMGGGWFLGGSIAYENSRLSTTDGLNSGRGQAGHGALTAKYQTGPWLFSGAVFGGAGAFNSTRMVTLPGFGSIARGSPTLSNLGGLLRATYTLGGEEFYLRPSMTLSLIHARSSAWRESGAGVLNLEVSGASSTIGAMTPALEVGGRVNFANGVVMRLFTSVGVSLLSSGRWSQESRLVSSPSGARFETVVQTDRVAGRVIAGGQVFATDRLELRLQYEGEVSANLTSHGGSMTLAYRF